jgi:hypothetical protein
MINLIIKEDKESNFSGSIKPEFKCEDMQLQY